MEVNTNNLISRFEKKDGKIVYKGSPCIIYFYATWCKPCQTQSLVFNELSEEYNKSIEFYKFNIEEEGFDLAEFFTIKSLPTMVICSDNNVKTVVGLTSKQKLESMINDNILQQQTQVLETSH